MNFNIGESYFINNDKLGGFNLADDSSLLYNNYWADYRIYNISLGGNWRFQLIADCDTGRCIKIESFLSGLIVKCLPLFVPKFERRELYFVTDEVMQQGSGCYYFPFLNEACYDHSNKILSFGDHNAIGQAIEFAPNIISIINDGALKCVYLLLDDITDVSTYFD